MNGGKIFLVGLGPGDTAHMTLRAREAIAEADCVIGYTTYIKLVTDLIDGKEVIRKGMTEELDRCYEALARARAGRKVALISSGDSGVYGMAGPTFEVLLDSGWRPGDDIDVEVVPGSSAINSCAALVGAPLTHDACTISLSDLLTPWPVIARRLEAAARGDFVVALYNPKSGRRTGQIVEAQRLLLLHRKPDTPVAIVKSAFRRRQRIELSTLSAMADSDIGMLTTVIVGNSNTFVREGLMVTPRGYRNKYTTETTGVVVREGEQSGRSLTMGLLGWQTHARTWLDADTNRSLRDAARHFDMPLGDILRAIAVPEHDVGVGEWRSVAVAQISFTEALDVAGQWGRLRAVVRSETGSVAELLIDKASFVLNNDWLNLICDSFHLHVPWNRVHALFIAAHRGTVQGLHAVDAHGEALLSLLPAGLRPTFDAAALTQHLTLLEPAVEPSTESDNDDE